MHRVKIGDIINIQGEKELYRNQKVTDIKIQEGNKSVRCLGWLVYVSEDNCKFVKCGTVTV